jgi:hypothetical protein
MNLVEAVRSRKPFRRPSDTATYGNDWWVDLTTGSKTVALDSEDIIAEDWEVKHDEKAHEVGTF